MTPDRLILSDRLITMAGPEADAMQGVAIRGDRIERLITRDEVEALRGSDTEVIDVGDRPLLPGFIDVHAHAEVACRAVYGTVDCCAPECSTVEEGLQALATGREAAAETGWIVGQANLFFDRKLRERRLPTREGLDRVSGDVGIALRAGGHITVLNSKGLELAGIDRDREAPSHSITGKPIIERDADREPTGSVKEMDNVLPLPRQTPAVVRDVLRTGIATLFTRYGVTVRSSRMPVDLIVLYRPPADPEAFERHYRTVHVPLVHAMPHLLSFETSTGPVDTQNGDAVPSSRGCASRRTPISGRRWDRRRVRPRWPTSPTSRRPVRSW